MITDNDVVANYVEDTVYIDSLKAEDPYENRVNLATVERTERGLVVITYNYPMAKKNEKVQKLVKDSIERFHNFEMSENTKNGTEPLSKVRVGLSYRRTLVKGEMYCKCPVKLGGPFKRSSRNPSAYRNGTKISAADL